VDQALYAVVIVSYTADVSSRRVVALVDALVSQSGISKSRVSRIWADIDVQVQAYSRAVLVAMGVNADGQRELLGLKGSDSGSKTFWNGFISTLRERGLTGVKLVIAMSTEV